VHPAWSFPGGYDSGSRQHAHMHTPTRVNQPCSSIPSSEAHTPHKPCPTHLDASVTGLVVDSGQPRKAILALKQERRLTAIFHISQVHQHSCNLRHSRAVGLAAVKSRRSAAAVAAVVMVGTEPWWQRWKRVQRSRETPTRPAALQHAGNKCSCPEQRGNQKHGQRKHDAQRQQGSRLTRWLA